MPGVQVTVSPDGIVDLIALTEADLSAEQSQPVLSAPQHEALVASIQSGTPLSLDVSAPTGLSDADRQAIIRHLANRRSEFKDWVERNFESDKDRMKALAELLLDRAKRMGVEAAKYLEQFQRRFLQGLIRSYLLGPIPVDLSSGTSSLEANQITVATTVTVSPSLTVSDPGAVAEMLVSLFNVAIDLSIQYGPAAL